jgi:hypothetical protein
MPLFTNCCAEPCFLASHLVKEVLGVIFLSSFNIYDFEGGPPEGGKKLESQFTQSGLTLAVSL